MIQIIIADDNIIILQSLKAILARSDDIELVGEANNGEEVIQLAISLNPDVILMDFNMPEFNGIEAMSWLKKQDVAARILMLTAFNDDALIEEALKKGAAGYLVKHSSSEELIEAIHKVYEGERYLGRGVHPPDDKD